MDVGDELMNRLRDFSPYENASIVSIDNRRKSPGTAENSPTVGIRARPRGVGIASRRLRPASRDTNTASDCSACHGAPTRRRSDVPTDTSAILIWTDGTTVNDRSARPAGADDLMSDTPRIHLVENSPHLGSHGCVSKVLLLREGSVSRDPEIQSTAPSRQPRPAVPSGIGSS